MQKEFEVKSGAIVCSDPCYSIPTWCQGIVENVKNGTWVAKVIVTDEGEWGKRVALLSISHKDIEEPDANIDIMNFVGGVDSGQFGFFDKDFYRNDELAKDLEKEDFGTDYDVQDGDAWYRACSKQTLGDEQWGVMSNGVVSSSGYGDGSYDVYGAKDGSEYVHFCVIFIHADESGDVCDDDGDVCGVCNEELNDCDC